MTLVRRLALTAIGVAFAASAVPILLVLDDHSTGAVVPWVGMLVAFALAEHVAIHLPMRKSAHSLPLDELPLVIGLAFMAPVGLLSARLVGGLIGLLADRGTTMPRRAYTIAQYTVATSLGILVSQQIAPGNGFTSPQQWLAVSLGAVVAGAVGLSAVLVAVGISEGPPQRRELAHSFATSTAVTIVNTSVASLAAFICVTDSRAAVLILPAAVFCGIGYRAYVDAHRHRAQLELITEMLRAAAAADDPETALAGLLKRTADALHSTTASTILLSSRDDTPSWKVIVDDGSVAVTALRVGDNDQVTAELGANDDRDASLTAHLKGEQGIVGLLTVSGRHCAAGPFKRSDQTLLQAVALQAGAIIERTRIERMLAVANERQHELLYEATHDPLTKLANRRRLLAELETRLAADDTIAVMLIDLDAFKPINDVHGHSVGDELLCLVAERLLLHTSPEDLVARLGGDEFAIVRHDRLMSPISWKAHGDELAALLVEPYATSVGALSIGASIGVANSQPGMSPGRLLAAADQSMYQSKRLALSKRR
jgi:diguanylate cyclase (GGDEF)-like protein